MAQAFEFKHLPMDGGLYDQNPGILDRFMYILGEQEKHREKEENARKRKEMGPTPKNAGKGLGTSRPG